MTGEMWSALAVIPTYNERENLPRIAAAVLEQDERLHILVVDDASPDGTGAIADELARETPRLRVLHRTGARGLGPSYVDGLQASLLSSFDYMLTMDADFSHAPSDVMRLIEAVASGRGDVAIGSRWAPGGGTVDWPLSRRLISRTGSGYARRLLGLDVRDATGGFKCFRRAVLERIELSRIQSTGYVFNVEIAYRAVAAGYRLSEVPIVFRERTVGESKMSLRIILEAAYRLPQLRGSTNVVVAQVAPPAA